MGRRQWQDGVIGWGIGIGAAALFLVLTAVWPDTPDGWFHLQRVRALSDALRWGVIYPRWFPDFAFGYGYPVLNFYAPAFYYGPALLHLMGVDIIPAVRGVLALGYGLSGVAAYVAARRFLSPWGAVAAAVFYLVYPYHLYDMFVRGAYPEFIAFVWPPLLLWAAHRLHVHGQAMDFLWVVFSWSGLILTHNLTAFMVGCAYGLALLVMLWRIPRVALRHGFALVLGTLLASFYVWPALWEMRWVGLGSGPDVHGYVRHLIALQDVFTWSGVYHYPTADVPVVPVPAYVGILVVVAAVVGGRDRRPLWGVLMAAVLLLLVIMSRASAPLWDALSFILGKLQFPWRWHTLLTLAGALLLGLLVDWWTDQRPFARAVLTVGVILYLGVYGLWGLRVTPAWYTDRDVTVEQMWAFDAEHGQVGASWTGEFLPRWVTEQRWAIGREPTVSTVLPAARITELHLQREGYLSLTGEYTAAIPSVLTFHRFYYPAWQVRVDGQVVSPIPLTNLGLLAVRVPAGQHTFDVRWRPTWAVNWGRSLTALAWFLVFMLIVRVRKRVPSRLAVVWGVVGLLSLVGSLGILERHVPLPLTHASYSQVSLAGSRVEVQGEMALVRLHWLVQMYAPGLTVFVHLVDEHGHVVTQHDAPLGGIYTPPSRQFPGLLLPDDHPVSLKGVPPGRYHWVIGLYPPADPAHPLVPVRGTTPFVDLGTILVGGRQ